MNYEEVEPHLISHFILSFEERRKLTKETLQDQKWYVIEKMNKGTEEMFHSFLKALEESQDAANHELKIYLQQAHCKTEKLSPMYLSEMLHTLSNSMPNELVFGEMPIQSPVWKNCKVEPSSYISTNSELPNQRKTEQTEPLSTASPNLPAESQNLSVPPLLSINNTSDPQDNWVIVYAQTDLTYRKNLVLLMEYICDKVTESLTGTNSVQQIYNNMNVSIKLAKAVYLAADPKTETSETRAADEQLRCSHKQLIKFLQDIRYSGINIDLDPILQRIDYSTDTAVLTECSIEPLINNNGC